jgi:hypothetical protein
MLQCLYSFWFRQLTVLQPQLLILYMWPEQSWGCRKRTVLRNCRMTSYASYMECEDNAGKLIGQWECLNTPTATRTAAATLGIAQLWSVSPPTGRGPRYCRATRSKAPSLLGLRFEPRRGEWLLCAVRYRSLCRADHSSIVVLPSVCVVECNQAQQEPSTPTVSM